MNLNKVNFNLKKILRDERKMCVKLRRIMNNRYESVAVIRGNGWTQDVKVNDGMLCQL